MTLATMEAAQAEVLSPSGIRNAAGDSVEALRQILIREGCRELSYDQAAAIGASLIEFFYVLAEEVNNGLAV
jgi:hypothetical protein